jgi:hypothetical protein
MWMGGEEAISGSIFNISDLYEKEFASPIFL